MGVREREADMASAIAERPERSGVLGTEVLALRSAIFVAVLEMFDVGIANVYAKDTTILFRTA